MPLMSMTGYGAADTTVENFRLSVELRSVNHRFLDVIAKLPPRFQSFEPDILKTVKAKLNRGRVEVIVNLKKDESSSEVELKLNKELFDSHLEIAKQALAVSGVKSFDDLEALTLNILQKRDVIEASSKEGIEKVIKKPLLETLEKALESLSSMREVEGAKLEAELQELLNAFVENAKAIEEKSAFDPQKAQEKLSERIAKLEVDADPQRIAQEVAILADKTDISEEVLRLKSHSEQFSANIKSANVGKKLEFVLQEMLREVNTIGSKTQNSDVTNLVIESKSVIEKLKEQVANIE